MCYDVCKFMRPIIILSIINGAFGMHVHEEIMKYQALTISRNIQKLL